MFTSDLKQKELALPPLLKLVLIMHSSTEQLVLWRCTVKLGMSMS